ncbi:MAG: CtsR family transcriptional regulator [Firmicutes bacterium]|nr:CtsR family transcriptional regulator [Bacillota bacterium]
MSTLSNQIEAYLKQMLSASEGGVIELKRSDLAGAFMCVPSQINYVLETRFSPKQGYMVESRRGGGGYVRIIRLAMENENDLSALLNSVQDQRVSRQSGNKLLERLMEEEFLTKREGMLVAALLNDAVLKSVPDPDALRCRMLNNVLQLLLRDDFI